MAVKCYHSQGVEQPLLTPPSPPSKPPVRPPQLEGFDICWFGIRESSCQQQGSLFQRQLAGWLGASLCHLCV